MWRDWDFSYGKNKSALGNDARGCRLSFLSVDVGGFHSRFVSV